MDCGCGPLEDPNISDVDDSPTDLLKGGSTESGNIESIVTYIESTLCQHNLELREQRNMQENMMLLLQRIEWQTKSQVLHHA